LLKVVAGILDLSFDELKRREVRRARRQQWLRTAAGIVVLLAATLAYLALGDIGVAVPGRETIQLALDHREWSYFRQVPSESAMQRAASALRAPLIEALADVRDGAGRFTQPIGVPGRWDPISHNQALAAVIRAPDRPAREMSLRLPELRAAFLTNATNLNEPNVYRDYFDPDTLSDTSQSPGLIWPIIALALASHDHERWSDSDRRQIAADIADLQRGLRSYRNATTGAWSLFPNQVDGGPANPYIATLILHAALELRRAGLPWEGSIGERDAILQSTARWLIDNYHSDGQEPGWRGTGQDERQVLDGLSLQAAAMLLRASNEAGVEVPPTIFSNVTSVLISCVSRTETFPQSSGEFEEDIMWRGTRRHTREAYRFLWYPWALEAMRAWLDYAQAHEQPVEDVVRIRRARSHLLGETGRLIVTDAAQDLTFIAAEVLYGLGSIPAPE
jgi:hypothetical protein